MLSDSTWRASWFWPSTRSIACSIGTSCTKIVVLPSLLMSLSKMKLMPVWRDSTSNTILVGASRNCSVTGRLSRVRSLGVTATGPRAALDPRAQHRSRRIARVLGQHSAQTRVRLIRVAVLEFLAGGGHALGVPPIGLDALQAPGGAAVAAFDDEHALVGRFRRIGITGSARLVALADQLRYGFFVPALEIELVAEIARIAGRGLIELLQRRLVAALVEFVEALLMQTRARTGNHQQGAGQHHADPAGSKIHCAPPMGKVC